MSSNRVEPFFTSCILSDIQKHIKISKLMFFTNLKNWSKSRVRNGFKWTKQNFERVDLTQLIGWNAFFEILFDPFLLIGLNKDDGSFKLTQRYLLGVLILTLRERAEVRNCAWTSPEGMTNTLEMDEFQSCNYFTTSIEAIFAKA
ncbi:20903_t:CDS:2 [Cetraspora pellucida]|uniref:20903_t:CDS:1 n=1 Tax=Cetraspora pellucida TaxID=1433469 RepID=A0A9N9NLH3_9GLOM|nr:20903_t:CDS:2 [Cetraspora pellucida]